MCVVLIKLLVFEIRVNPQIHGFEHLLLSWDATLVGGEGEVEEVDLWGWTTKYYINTKNTGFWFQPVLFVS